MSRRNETITLALSPTHKASLEAKALAAGFTWGEDGKPNVSAWLRAIAENEIETPTAKGDDQIAQREKVDRALAKLTKAIAGLN